MLILFLWATTCIGLKKFKVRQVCGQVRTVTGDEIPDAIIQVTKNGDSKTAARTESDHDGNFSFGRLDEGEYAIRIDVPGFHTASQEFEIRRPMKDAQAAHIPFSC